jgi:adenylyltransferase/sulfurtransferase
MTREITPDGLAARLAEGTVTYLLDVREGWEVQVASLAGAAHVPLGELPHRLAELDPPPGALLVTICHHGVRSLSAAALLEQAGHDNVVSLAGGIDAWSRQVDPGVPRY